MGPRPANPLDAELVFPPDHARLFYLLRIPLAYYGVHIWLRSFAYKTPIYVWVFLVALVIIMTLTVSTVTFQSYRAAMANPASKLGH